MFASRNGTLNYGTLNHRIKPVTAIYSHARFTLTLARSGKKLTLEI